MNVAVSAAWSVVSKALGPVSDGFLEAWAASKDLGPNIDALKMELLYVQGMLNNTRGREIDNPALNELLQKLRQLAYGAEDVLDELDYFRIQDGIYGTYEAADAHAKGCVCNLFLNAHHTAKAVGKLLGCSCAAANPRGPEGPRSDEVRCCAWPCARRSARGDTSFVPNTDQADGEASGCIRKLASGALNTVRTVGKFLPCSSFPPVHDDVSGKLALCGACKRKAPQRKHAKEAPKLDFDRVDLSKRMKHIVDQLQPLCAKVIAILNLELLGSNHSTTPSIAKSPPTTTSDNIESTLYGRDPAKKRIIDCITDDKYSDEYLTVLPIVGPGGIGKTTLIQHIYNSQEVKTHFQVKIWICVSQNFIVNKLIEEIEKAIPSVEGEKKGRAEELIEQRLNSKSLLLILDDIWKCESEDWKRLLVPLTKGQAKGNVILVTTRFPAVAEIVKTTDNSIDLEGLEHGEFRIFFRACIFGDEQSQKDHDGLLKIGDKIAKKLKGSPLAAKTVGRLLRNHLDVHHWTRVLESREWEMQTGERDIMPALKLSYDYLPYHLQQCFSSCALFPEDYKFNSEELINFWIGLDILHPGGRNKIVEDVGLDSLSDLVNSGFFKKDETDGHTCYIIHDLLHDLALKVASHECLSLHHSNARLVEIRPSIRHLSIITDGPDDSNGISDENFKSELRKLKTKLKVENLQTLIIFGGGDKSFVNILGDLFIEANALRVLCLPTLSYPLESLLRNFSSLLHLRYLKLGTTMSQMHLPTTLSRFYHLKILDLQKWGGSFCLPSDMSNLAKVCHFLAQHNELHSGIHNVGKLKLLQELKAFSVNKESKGFELNQLEHLVELREVGIYNLERIHTKEEAVEAKLMHKEYLHKLTLDWDSERPNTEPVTEGVVLESLHPHRNLQELRITGHRGPSCPTWLGDKLAIEALQSLYLLSVSWDIFPSFGKMGNLRELGLSNISTIKEFDLEESFCNPLISFPHLQVLIITDCPKLSELPFSSHIVYPLKQDWNIDWFPKLQELKIQNCPEVLLLPPIPWTQSLCSVKISDVGSKLLVKLVYSKSSSGVELEVNGKDGLHNLDQLLLFSQLTELQELQIKKCPPLELKYFLMLTSLKTLWVLSSNLGVVPSEIQSSVEWHHPVEDIKIWVSDSSGKELTQFLSHLPKLSKLGVFRCENITQFAVGVDLQQTTAPVVSSSTSSDVKMDDTQAKDEQQEIAEVDKEEANTKDDGGLLLLPAHLSNSLQALDIDNGCLVVQSLDALQALTTLHLGNCCFRHPFPSSLLDLQLKSMKGVQTLSNLTSLTRLGIYFCGEDLRCEGLLPLLTQGQLSKLEVRGSPSFFDDMEGFLGAPALCGLLSSSLTSLYFNGNDETARFTKEHEEAFHLLTSLQELWFFNCGKLEHLPAGLNKLTNLKRLYIYYCPALQSLPKEGLPSSLREIYVESCGNAELIDQVPLCLKRKGAEEVPFLHQVDGQSRKVEHEICSLFSANSEEHWICRDFAEKSSFRPVQF
uniref:NBS-LRR disease resistance protein n=1 Tax=Dasypyrum villosum TaxID=40247 RepID=A0A8K1MK42_9POAL|nr:NBS-LRR disease resistance protein [Dasypyrum villosum]